MAEGSEVPVEFGLWRIDGKPRRVASSHLAVEKRLEDLLAADIGVLDLDVMVVGRQVVTDFGSVIDLLAIDGDGELYVIELKRDRTPRDIVAQTLDYASWVKGLGYERVGEIFRTFSNGLPLEDAFVSRFKAKVPDPLNAAHHMVIVASELDPNTERIVAYLNDSYGVPLNAVFFKYLVDDDREYLARTWFIDPQQVEVKATRSGGAQGRPPWNGQDFYVTVGEAGGTRSWEDDVTYGFVSGGGGRWYSRTLEQLRPGHRVFAYIPGPTGYVGVGIVEEPAVLARDFTVRLDDGSEIPLLQAPLHATGMGTYADDPERSEYVVRVRWLETRTRQEAVWQAGMFANENTACALRDQFTLERLREAFPLADQDNASPDDVEIHHPR